MSLVELNISKNIVDLDATQNGFSAFADEFLTKYETVMKPDIYSPGRNKLKAVMEKRVLYTRKRDLARFPRGLLEFIPKEEYSVKSESKDTGNPIINVTDDQILNTIDKFKLRNDQIIAVKKCLLCKRGVIQLPTATGKSAIITSTIKIIHGYNPGFKFLVIAPTLVTVKNMYDTLIDNGVDAGIFGHPNKDFDHVVTVALVQSLASCSNYSDSSMINAVFYDECHHLKCDTWNNLNMMLPNAEYSLGFSALSIDKSEIMKSDIRDLSYDASLIVGNTGRVIMHMDPSYYINKGIIAKPVVVRLKYKYKLPEGFDESNWRELVELYISSYPRAYMFSSVVKEFSTRGRKVLVLVSEKKQAYMIGDILYKLGISRFGISFGAGKGYVPRGINDQEEVIYDGRDTTEVLSGISTGELDIVIATQHTDEGVDIKGLDVVVLFSPGKSDRRLIQRVGRVLRKSKNGKYAYVVDSADKGSKVLQRHARERMKIYKDTIGIEDNQLLADVSLEDVVKFIDNE